MTNRTTPHWTLGPKSTAELLTGRTAGNLKHAVISKSKTNEQTKSHRRGMFTIGGLVFGPVSELLTLGDVVSAWSSGTGAAGVVGALSYAAMTSLWSPEVVLRIITLAPLALLFFYFVVLKKPQNSVFQLTSSHLTRVTQTSQYPDSSEYGAPIRQSSNEEGADSPSNRQPLLRNNDPLTVQISPSWEAKKRIFMDIFPLIFALALVYFFEYLINQALFELVYFENAGMTQAQQYRWFQVIYQCGVFASRSSLKLFKIHRTWIMAVLQGMNFILVLVHVLRPYVVNISAFFSLIAFEGILGGLSYVNTFHRVLTMGNPNTREYSMSISAFADAFGITCAAFAAIPLHNYLCRAINS
nr:battenin [Hymenolepis microstoma]